MADSQETETPMSIDDSLIDVVSQTNPTEVITTVNEEKVTEKMEVADNVANEFTTVESDGTAVQYITTNDDNLPKTEGNDGTAKEFTAIDEHGNEVHYVTMTPEEAAAAGVEEDEQVVTTSLQFDPANPSVLYTADGTPINQADLSPEEQALVQAALQQHLAEQEAEQQLALIDQSAEETATVTEQQVESTVTDAITESNVSQETSNNIPEVTSVSDDVSLTEPQASITSVDSTADPVAVITPTTTESVASAVDFVSSSAAASKVVQSLADSVRRQAEYKKAKDLLNRANSDSKGELPQGFRYEEKIVIRQGQPQVVKVPVRSSPVSKRPEIPSVLANLMPKIEIGKDGSQVIRIHQSQITADQLKSLQENPNVRLVFRPASSSRNRSSNASPYGNQPRKRGRPRKNFISSASAPSSRDLQISPSKINRYGRTMKTPYHQKDYLSGDLENGDISDDSFASASLKKTGQIYPVLHSRRGRPPGSFNKNSSDRGYRRPPSVIRRMEQLREQELQHDEELNNARLSIVPQKPVLSSIELAISTRRKNRLRELLSACSEQEIMEVALPHLARVFSLWEFLIMKVEKNKSSRVYFADVYKEYEVLHRYVSRLTEKYKEALIEQKLTSSTGQDTTEASTENEVKAEKKKFLKVRCKALAQSLQLEEDELEDAFITLLDAEELPRPLPKLSHLKDAEKATNSLETTTGTEIQKEGSALGLLEASDNIDVEKITVTSAEVGSTGVSASNDLITQVASTEKLIPTDTSGQTAVDPESAMVTEGIEPSSGGTQIIQIGTGDDKQFIEVPEGYTLIQTPDGLVMSQPGTTLSQGEDGTIYVTHEDGTMTTLDSQKTVSLDTVDSLMTLEDQEQA